MHKRDAAQKLRSATTSAETDGAGCGESLNTARLQASEFMRLRHNELLGSVHTSGLRLVIHVPGAEPMPLHLCSCEQSKNSACNLFRYAIRQPMGTSSSQGKLLCCPPSGKPSAVLPKTCVIVR